MASQKTKLREPSWLKYSLLPGLAWLSCFMTLPLLFVISLSFLTRGIYGEVIPTLTGTNYIRLVGFNTFGFDPIYLRILLRTFSLSLVSTFLCALLAIPLTLGIARLPAKFRTIALLLLIVPFWTNLLIRTYAWMILLAPDGAITEILRPIFGIQEDYGLYPSIYAVIVALICDYLPYMALPLYASVEKIDWSLVEAAHDLGASRLTAFRHAILPQIQAGLAAGILLVFIPSLGQYVIPDLLGGSSSALLGNTLAQQFGSSRDWPFGAACGTLQIVFALAFLLFRRGRLMDGVTR